jgi:hypothetical protein
MAPLNLRAAIRDVSGSSASAKELDQTGTSKPKAALRSWPWATPTPELRAATHWIAMNERGKRDRHDASSAKAFDDNDVHLVAMSEGGKGLRHDANSWNAFEAEGSPRTVCMPGLCLRTAA